jgi:hypothetical protein
MKRGSATPEFSNCHFRYCYDDRIPKGKIKMANKNEIEIYINERHPDVLKLRDGEAKLKDLRSRRTVVEKQLSLGIEMRQSHATQLEAEAAMIINGANAASTPRPIEELSREVQVLTLAIEKQQQIVEHLRRGFSRAVCNEPANRAAYIAIEKRIAGAVQSLAEANEAEVELFTALHRVGCNSVSFRPMRIQAVGLASDSQSLAAFHKRECEEFKVLS